MIAIFTLKNLVIMLQVLLLTTKFSKISINMVLLLLIYILCYRGGCRNFMKRCTLIINEDNKIIAEILSRGANKITLYYTIRVSFIIYININFNLYLSFNIMSCLFNSGGI